MLQDQIVTLLTWMIIGVGGILLSVLLWIFLRVQKHIDDLPNTISEKVNVVHGDLVGQMVKMNDTHSKLEQDLRDQFTKLDRRVTVLEVMQGVEGGFRMGGPTR